MTYYIFNFFLHKLLMFFCNIHYFVVYVLVNLANRDFTFNFLCVNIFGPTLTVNIRLDILLSYIHIL